MAKSLDEHLFSPGPKKILALSGGGTRGIVSIAFLEQIEKILADKYGTNDFRLSDHFDLIGGTSVGSLIGTQLALGHSVADIKERFLHWSPKIFRRPWLRIVGLHPKFDARQLAKRIREVAGDETLASEKLQTGLAIVIKRLDTGSPWIVTNNPRAKFFNDPEDGSYIGNNQYELFNLVRASTAAPYFFAPKSFEIIKGKDIGVFVDGGVSPHNNPAMQLLMLAGISGYGFNWPLGEDQIHLTSIGTGLSRVRMSSKEASRKSAALLGIEALRGLISDNDMHTLTLLQWMSNSKTSWPINSEIEDLSGDILAGADQPLLSFSHFDVRLERDWLQQNLNIDLTNKQLEEFREIDNPSLMPELYKFARAAAVIQITEDLIVDQVLLGNN